MYVTTMPPIVGSLSLNQGKILHNCNRKEPKIKVCSSTVFVECLFLKALRRNRQRNSKVLE